MIFEASKAKIEELIKVIGSKADTENDNLLRLSIIQVTVYLDFLEIIFTRYQEVNARLIKNRKIQETFRAGKVGSWTMSGEEMIAFEESRMLFSQLRLEIESFYLFTHILLNKAVNFPERYFQHSLKRGVICGSHRKFWKSIKKSGVFFPLSDSLIDSADWLTEKVVRYRDDRITHTLETEHNKRMLIAGFTYGPEGLHKMMSGVLYPKENSSSQQIETEHIEDIISYTNTFLKEYVDFLLLHLDKSILNNHNQEKGGV